MMLVSPIALALDHCASMNMSDHLSKSQINSVTVFIKDISSSNYQAMDMGRQSIQDKMNCNSSSSCKYHVCGTYDINLSSLTFNPLHSQSEHSGFEYLSSNSIPISPDIRPPIFIL